MVYLSMLINIKSGRFKKDKKEDKIDDVIFIPIFEQKNLFANQNFN